MPPPLTPLAPAAGICPFPNEQTRRRGVSERSDPGPTLPSQVDKTAEVYSRYPRSWGAEVLGLEG
eukprot:1157720-Pyramimonas_sp.AAC.1